MDRNSLAPGSNWPQPADPSAADRLIERVTEAGGPMTAAAALRGLTPLLRAIGGNSPFLSDLVVREQDCLLSLVGHGPDQAARAVLDELGATAPSVPTLQVRAALRRARRQLALVAAAADLGGLWPLDTQILMLSNLADAALTLAVGHLLRTAHDRGRLKLPDPERPGIGSGLAVLGMGKLGARELNYSSDVDLVLLYDPSAAAYSPLRDTDATASFAARLTHDLVALMGTRDADGYVFRVDLRLRPDPGATPPAVSLPAAIAYYESMGQNWERAAMLKARPVAGDLDMGAAFLREIRPFVWRQHHDFAAIADIHALKRRIAAHAGGALGGKHDPASRLLGYNVKLGEGGIRDIEFLVQTLQLVYGGRDPTLREPTTLGALERLAGAGHLEREAATSLSGAYRFLRRAEHRLQMVADRQTHTLPDKPPALEHFAIFMGYPDALGFADDLGVHLETVRAHCADLFVSTPSAEIDIAPFDLSGPGDVDPDAVARIRSLGFDEPGRILSAARAWQAGRPRALRTARARELITEMLPRILAALARQPTPDVAFARFDRFVGALPAGIQLLSLFARNPRLLDRVAAVLGSAPLLAEHLARHPAALDGLLSPEPAHEPTQLLAARLADAQSLEEAILTTRHTVREEDFGITVAMLEDRIDADRSGLDRSALADAAIEALLPRVLNDFATRHGAVPEGALAVVALGKAGGREMMAGSDLDLMLVYDHPPQATESSPDPAGRRLPAGVWFLRACQAFVAALTTPGTDGPLYAVDMRLRPSGNKGPVAVSLSSFRRYHEESAWTWERLALTRARVVAGPPTLCTAIAAAIGDAMDGAAAPDRVRADVAAMRVRMLRDLAPEGPWDVKVWPGGQVEVEFIAQTLQLIGGRTDHALRRTTTRDALAALGAAGRLEPAEVNMLVCADRIWRTVQGMLRLTVGRGAPLELPEATARPLLRAAAKAGMPASDLPELRASLEGLAKKVRAAFLRHVGPIGG
jgi:glutamate-ammonia-ligase adenylyltransferase